MLFFSYVRPYILLIMLSCVFLHSVIYYDKVNCVSSEIIIIIHILINHHCYALYTCILDKCSIPKRPVFSFVVYALCIKKNNILNLTHTAPFKQPFMLLYISSSWHNASWRIPNAPWHKANTSWHVPKASWHRPNAYQIQSVSILSLIVHYYFKRLVKHHNVIFVNDDQCEFVTKKRHIGFTAQKV